jgi:hypothetical protein
MSIGTSPEEPALSLSKGTAENSPGRKSWVYIATETSPEEPALSLSKGTAENAPGRKSWVYIPTGTSPEGDG